MRSLLRLLLTSCFLLGASAFGQQVIISEFMASNSNSVADEDGEREDWIEIHNGTTSTVNLLGWYLTDDAGQPRKWAFPSRNLAAGAYLYVFASDKNRRPASGNLHTNFKLSASPDYIALTKDIAGGGVQVVHFYNYPQQATDVAYGTKFVATATTLVAAGASAKTFIPTIGNGGATLGATWRGALANEPFNDAAWTAGTTAVGFPNAGVATANLKLRLNANENATLVADTSGAAHNGVNNGATWIAASTDANGRTRHGTLLFGATDSNGAATGDQVIVPAHADFNAGTGTIAFWLKTAGQVADGGNAEGAMIFDRRGGGGGSQGLVLTLTGAGNLSIQPGPGSPNNFASTGTVNDDKWHHCALVFDTANGQSCTFYIDGVASGTQSNSGAWSFDPAQQIEIGRSHDTYWRRLNGQLDDFRLYDTALTQPQLQQIYNDGDEPVTPGTDVQAAMLSVNPSAFIRVPFDIANPASVSGLNLTMRWNDGYVVWINGTQVASFAAPAAPLYDSAATQSHSAGAPFVTAIAASVLRAGSNILAVQALNTAAGDGVFSALPQLDGTNTAPGPGNYFATATPGTANGATKTNVGPFVSSVTKNPNPRPTGNAASPPLVITAKVTPSLRPLAASNPVQLKYRVMYNSETSLVMTDLGVLPGDPATTRTYSASIPTATLGAGQMLRWRVVATDNTAIAGTAPEYSDPLDNEQYYGTVATDATIETNLPVLYWFISSSTAADNTTGTRCSYFYKAPGDTGVGRFYDNVEANIHGQSSSGFAKKSYDLDFNEDNRFEWNVAGKRVKDVNLMTNWGDKAKTHNQMSHEALAVVGSVHHWCHQIRVQQVTPANAASPASHFWSIADLMEDGDDDFIERNGRDPQGALYKIYDSLTGGGEKKTRQQEGTSDLQALVAGLNPANALSARRLYAYDNMDLAQCVSYFVGLAIISSQDHGHKNYYVYRDSVGTREWSILPWDVDLTWGRNWLDASGYFTDTMFTNNELDMYNSAQQNKGENRLYSLFVGNSDIARVPATELRNMVLRRLRTVLDGYFSAPNILENRFAALADLMDPPAIGTSDADRDRTKWGTWGNDGGNTAGGTVLRYHINQLRNVYLTGRRTFLNTATLAGASVPASQPANAVNLITLETVDFNPASGTQEHEYFLIRNSNTYAVDISGWQITGAVNFTFKPGTVIPAGGGTTENIGHLFVAKNPYLFRQRPTTPRANQYCYVTGPYSGQLSARGETIELRDAAGNLLKTKTWTPAPTAAQNQLRVTELNYAPAGPSVAEAAALPGVTAADFEYIELRNIGGTALNLAGAYFDEGLTFTFPAAYTLAAGARCLVVANLAAFQQRYGTGLNGQIAGIFEGNLDNAGEHIQLKDVNGETILDFAYSDAWFPPSDGGGRTLVSRSTTPDWNSYDAPQGWALSGAGGGSPGVADADFAYTYEGWRWDHFAFSEFATIGGPAFDVEDDALINVGEYAFGRAAKTADSAPLSTSSIVNESGTDYLAITFKRRHNALDLTFIIEAADSPAGPWTPVTTQVGATVDLGNGVDQVTIRDSQPKGATPRFIRVRATK